MPLILQTKLLRALETHSVQRLGGDKNITLDLRIVCATHQNLMQLVDDGQFRADLYFRLAVFPIEVPPLCVRAEDIPLIMDKIQADHAHLNPAFPTPVFDTSAIEALARHKWPGNVRELRNVIERAFIMLAGETISGEHVQKNLLKLHLPAPMIEDELNTLWEETEALSSTTEEIPEYTSCPPMPEAYRSWFSHYDNINLRSHLRDIEAVIIEAALKANDGLVSRAAEATGLRRTTLIEKMKKLMIERPSNSS